MGVSEMMERVKEAIGMAWHDKPMPSPLEPKRLLPDLQKILLSAVLDVKAGVDLVTDGY